MIAKIKDAFLGYIRSFAWNVLFALFIIIPLNSGYKITAPDNFATLYFVIFLPLFLLAINSAITLSLAESSRSRVISHSTTHFENAIEVRPLLEFLTISIGWPIAAGFVALFLARAGVREATWLQIFAMFSLLASFVTTMVVAAAYGKGKKMKNKKGAAQQKPQPLSVACLWIYRGVVCLSLALSWWILDAVGFGGGMPIGPVIKLAALGAMLLLGLACGLAPFWLLRRQWRVVWLAPSRIPARRYLRIMMNAQPEPARKKSRNLMKIGLALIGLGISLIVLLELLKVSGVV